eukprot:scaffold112231_cov84-Phaeocystis_antarctica.AAC.1
MTTREALQPLTRLLQLGHAATQLAVTAWVQGCRLQAARDWGVSVHASMHGQYMCTAHACTTCTCVCGVRPSASLPCCPPHGAASLRPPSGGGSALGPAVRSVVGGGALLRGGREAAETRWPERGGGRLKGCYLPRRRTERILQARRTS